jgi:diguanylate cyclase (GGDEF)-like protein
MKSEESRIHTKSVLDRLGMMTASRDVELLELSVLRTLSDLLHLPEIVLFNLTDALLPHHLVVFRQDHQVSAGLHRHSEDQEVSEGQVEIPKSWIDAASSARHLNKPCMVSRDEGYATVFPVLGFDVVMGYIVIRMERALTSAECQLIEGLLRIVHNFYALLIDSQKDKLTGLLNRKTFDYSVDKVCSSIVPDLEEEGETGRRNSDPDAKHTYWLGIIDIDHFKAINDRFGHLYGDEVLLLLSQIMRRSFREQDHLFRYGGEEFLVITLTTKKGAAAATFERFRKAVESFHFPQVGRVTVSIGVVQIKGDTIATEIVGQADQALYYAKDHGRNRLCFYADLVEAGELERQIETVPADLF